MDTVKISAVADESRGTREISVKSFDVLAADINHLAADALKNPTATGIPPEHLKEVFKFVAALNDLSRPSGL